MTAVLTRLRRTTLGTVTGVDPTPREVAVLSAIERRLSNAEIAAELYISVRTVESHIASLRRKLVATTRGELIDAAIQRRRRSVSLPPDSFVGRGAEVAAVSADLAAAGVLVVTGVAGVGKSRLALSVAAAVGAVPVRVGLADTPAAHLLPSLARVLGVASERSQDLLHACALALSPQPSLVVLDDADAVTTAAVGLARNLVRLAPSTRVIVTTRASVPPTVRRVVLEPLALDDADDGAPRLFLDRWGGEIAGDDDRRRIERLCAMLDGLPLALELAAAAANHVGLAELEGLLARGLDALDQDDVTRHGSLSRAIASSLRLLSQPDRQLLTPLAVIPGSFTLDLATAVAGVDAAAGVLRLAGASLALADAPAPGGAAFRMLHTVREHVGPETGQEAARASRDRYAHHVAAQLRKIAERARADDRPSTAAAAAWLRPHAAASLRHLIETDADAAADLAASIAVCVEQYGPDPDSLAALAAVVEDAAVLGRCSTLQLHAIAEALCFLDLALAGRAARAACASSAATGHAWQAVGMVAAYAGDRAQALEALHRARAQATEDPWLRGQIAQAEAIAQHLAPSDAERAAAYCREAIEQYARAGDAMHVNNVRYMMAVHAADAGSRDPQARTWIQECVQYARAVGHTHELALAELVETVLTVPVEARREIPEQVDTLRSLGATRCLTRALALLARGQDPSTQVELLTRSLASARAAGDEMGAVVVLRRLIVAQWQQGAHDEAARSYGALAAAVGDQDAATGLPEAMRAELPQLRLLAAEGAARAQACTLTPPGL